MSKNVSSRSSLNFSIVNSNFLYKFPSWSNFLVSPFTLQIMLPTYLLNSFRFWICVQLVFFTVKTFANGTPPVLCIAPYFHLDLLFETSFLIFRTQRSCHSKPYFILARSSMYCSFFLQSSSSSQHLVYIQKLLLRLCPQFLPVKRPLRTSVTVPAVITFKNKILWLPVLVGSYL